MKLLSFLRRKLPKNAENKVIPKILFVCQGHKHRSNTAETMYKEDSRFEVKSAGMSELADTSLNPLLIDWADYIFVMETFQEEKLKELFPDRYQDDRVFNLEIEDKYEYMDNMLMATLKSKFEDVFFLFIENK